MVHLFASAPVNATWGSATGINDNGDVVGYYYLDGGDSVTKPFLYLSGRGFVRLTEFEGLYAVAQGINDNGQIILSAIMPGREAVTGFRYTPGVGYQWLGTLGREEYDVDVPLGVNNLGQVVGRSDTWLGSEPWQYAFLYSDGIGMVSLGSLSPLRYSTATAINDFGQITGHSGGYAFFYTEESGMVAIGRGAGLAINNHRVVVGEGFDGIRAGAAMFADGTTRWLGNLGGDSLANDVNDYNVVVGYSNHPRLYPSLRSRSGFIWTEAEGMVNLNTLAEPGWPIVDAVAINNNGQIAGAANGVAVRLDPIPPKLALRASTTGLVVSWSPAWPGVVLESTETLGTPSWQPLDNAGTNVVTLPREGLSRFFRLNLEALRGLCCPPQP